MRTEPFLCATRCQGQLRGMPRHGPPGQRGVNRQRTATSRLAEGVGLVGRRLLYANANRQGVVRPRAGLDEWRYALMLLAIHGQQASGGVRVPRRGYSNRWCGYVTPTLPTKIALWYKKKTGAWLRYKRSEIAPRVGSRSNGHRQHRGDSRDAIPARSTLLSRFRLFVPLTCRRLSMGDAQCRGFPEST